jgi:predicted nucleic acid-binding protein
MIIGDSSALVALSVMGRLDLLEIIFEEIYVPQAVYDEVVVLSKPEGMKLKKFLAGKVIDAALGITKIGLGRGELEAISLYKTMDADFLLIDDKRAKKFAELNGVNVIGSIGVVLLAKELGKVKTIRDDLEKLLKSNVFVSKHLIERILIRVDE